MFGILPARARKRFEKARVSSFKSHSKAAE
jgi:hypothetical protein